MVEELFYETVKSKLYKVSDLTRQRFEVKKVLNKEFPTDTEVRLFFNEYDILNGNYLKHSRNVFKKYTGHNGCMVFLEWVEGKTLKEFFAGKPDIARFIEIMIKVCDGISEIHQHKIIHRDINPYNILVSSDDNIKILDFEASAKIDEKQTDPYKTDALSGTIVYMSPEQTGRMNKAIDYRTDFYSLGITMYELLSGRLPFEADDAMGMIHAHLTQTALPLHLINKEIPEQLSAIVSKLLSKNAEDRYLSAYGIGADLENCLAQYKATSTIAFFPLAQNDFSGNLKLQKTLYGRESEITSLLQSFEQCKADGRSITLVTGSSGIGKSSLVHEVRKTILAENGYFISGKFDQLQRAVPYSAFLSAFRELTNRLITEDKQALSALKEKIAIRIGSEGKMITDIFPSLSLIVDAQSDATEIKGYEAQKKFLYLFCRMLEAIASREHPLVLFIDDLQWIDHSSLQLFEAIAQTTEIRHFFLIGAYRDNEVSDSHPLMLCMSNLKRKNVCIQTLFPGNLQPSHISRLLSDSLVKYDESIIKLADIICRKTFGNAFFVIQFIKALYERELIAFDTFARLWRCRLEEIEAINVTDNVVSLLVSKIVTLSQECQQILTLASCIGNTFDSNTLCIISSLQKEAIQTALEECLLHSLIVATGNGYRFVHDKVQQAAYSLIPEKDKSETHHKIALSLLANLGEDALPEHLFTVVNHYNAGSAQATKEERKKLAELNHKAGDLARRATAFRQAYLYYIQSIHYIITDNPDETTKTTALHNLAAEMAYSIADYEAMEKHIDRILQQATKPEDKYKASEIRILGFISQNKIKDALLYGLSLLNNLGTKFPSHVTQLHLFNELVRTKLFLSRRSIESLEHLPDAREPEKIFIVNILFQVLTPAYWTDTNLMAMIVLRAMRYCISAGTSNWTYYCYACYGALISELGELKNGYRFAQLSMRMLDRPDARATTCRVTFNYSIYVHHWNKPLQESLPFLLNAYHIGLETGDFEFASLAYYFYCQHFYLGGNELSECTEEMRKASDAILKLERLTAYNYHNIHYQAALNLRGLSADPLLLEGEAYRESVMRAKHEQENDNTALYKFYLQKMMLACLFGDYKAAVAYGEEAAKRVGNVTAQYCRALLLYYECLARFGCYSDASNKTKKRYEKKIKRNIAKIKKWSDYLSDNQYHKYLLLKAEWNRVKGGHNLLNDYDAAIEAAHASPFIQEEAMALELAGIYFDQSGKAMLAQMYLRNAYQKYRSWGAIAKLKQLEQKYPNYISSLSPNKLENYANTRELSNTSVSLASLDMEAVVKATATISGEVVLPKFLDSLLKVVAENAGASACTVLLEDNGTFLIEAYLDTNKHFSEVLQHRPVAGSGILSETVVNYVLRSKEIILLNNTLEDIRFRNDSYLSSQPNLSVLCMPILYQNKMMGILYLENNLSTNAFTEDRIRTLNLLSGQIATSIYNSLLYNSLEQKVEERTNELSNEKKKTDELLYNILPVETAKELKQYGKAEAKLHEQVSILFADMVGFTQISETLSPEELVSEIDICFSAFDTIISRYNIEKIKTIGDAYMAACGLPLPDPNHAEKIILAALDIRDFMEERRKSNNAVGFQVRIGIHSGPVVAGVVGHKKFQYDIWGDSVNTASRMESFGMASKVNISDSTYRLLPNKANCEYRGEINVKGKGKLNMYFVERN